MKNPKVVGVKEHKVSMMRNRHKLTVKRWYVELRFGTETARLAVSKATALWVQGKEEKVAKAKVKARSKIRTKRA